MARSARAQVHSAASSGKITKATPPKARTIPVKSVKGAHPSVTAGGNKRFAPPKA